MIDASSKDPKSDYETIRLELKKHDVDLLNKDEIIVMSKADQSSSLPKDFKYDVALSAITKDNLDSLLDKIITKL
jgi:GTPase involved in cell partitioning and DNA repair